MQCERCNKKKVTVYYRENRNGRIRALRLCGDCAERMEQAGELEDLSTPLAGLHARLFNEGLLASLPLPPEGWSRSSGRKCPSCGGVFSELAVGGTLGCPDCYESFSEELTEPLRILHGRVCHSGRSSAGHKARLERESRLEELRSRLKEAVTAEEYERAAALRDEIRGLEALR
jgi:protein arginine kinase activator